jgi:hypothetical protein
MTGISATLTRGRAGLAVGVAAALAAVLLGSGAATAAPLAGGGVSAAAIAGNLAGVSCTSASNCIAVGGRSPTSSSPAANLAEKWNGTKWSVLTTPSPTGSAGTAFYSVDCTSAKNCLAVGYYDTASHSLLPNAEQWNGTKWSLLTVPAPAGATDAPLDAIACTSATNCWASGSSGDNTLVERWNGSKWSIVSSPSPDPSKPNILSGLACPSASTCWAVGYTFPTNYAGSLTEKWNGSKWSVVTTPNSKSGQLIGDACDGTSTCLAVGISNSLFALAQRWNGTKWVTAAPAKPSGAADSELNGVSCSAAKACESVGNYYNSSVTATLGESWNGTKWAVQKMPAVSGSTYANLAGVSCATASDCWAAGESITSSAVTSPLLEKWNGSAWTVS